MLRRLVLDGFLLLLVAAVVVGAFLLLTRPPGRDGVSRATPKASELRVAAISDELTTSATSTVSAFRLAAVESGWDLELVEAPGVGYTTARNGGPNLPRIVEGQFDGAGVDAVVVQAGTADAQATAGNLGAGVTGTIARLRARVSQGTRIVLVGPVRARGQDQLAGVREVISAAATRQRVIFIDPIADRWLPATATGAALTGPEQRQVADRLARSLRVLGVTAQVG